MSRTVQGVKLNYYGLIESWEQAPEILEPHLMTEIGWFDIDDLPTPMIPHHRVALEALQK